MQDTHSITQSVSLSRSVVAGICLWLLPGFGSCWTQPTAVDLNTTNARRLDTTLSAAAGSGQTRGVVWSSDGEATDSLNGLFFSRSTDGGVSWSPRQDLIGISSLPLGSWGNQPCLSTDLGETWVIGWDACQVVGGSIQADRDVYFIRSTDAGVTWSSPATLNSNAADPLVRNHSVSLCSNRAGAWVAVFEADMNPAPGVPPRYFISAARSADNAQTWTPVQSLCPATSSTLHRNPHVATNGQGTWIAAWDSTETTDTDLRFCRSADNGVTWSTDQWLNTTAVSDDAVASNHDGNVRVAGNDSGVWIAVWTSSYDPASTVPVRDRIVYSRSVDNGLTWSGPSPVGSWTDPNRPVKHMADIVWCESQFVVLWSGPAGLEASRSFNDGATWTPPVLVGAGSGLEGRGESRPRLAAGTGCLRLGAWVHQPAGAPGPDIVAAQDQAMATAARDWHLCW